MPPASDAVPVTSTVAVFSIALSSGDVIVMTGSVESTATPNVSEPTPPSSSVTITVTVKVPAVV